MLKNLKILYTLKKKSQNFTVIFTIANFFEKFCPFFGEIFCTVQKITFFYAKYCRKIFNAKITGKICGKIYEKINGKHFNLLIQFYAARELAKSGISALRGSWNVPAIQIPDSSKIILSTVTDLGEEIL